MIIFSDQCENDAQLFLTDIEVCSMKFVKKISIETFDKKKSILI